MLGLQWKGCGFDCWPGRYHVVTTRMGDGLWAGKPPRYVRYIYAPWWSAANQLKIIVEVAVTSSSSAARHVAVDVVSRGGIGRSFLRDALHVGHGRVTCTPVISAHVKASLTHRVATVWNKNTPSTFKYCFETYSSTADSIFHNFTTHWTLYNKVADRKDNTRTLALFSASIKQE